MTEVLSRVRELGILAFYSPKQCNNPDVFPKGTMLFPDQPRHIFYIHLSLFHMRNEDVFTDLHLSCPISVFQCCPECGNKKSRMDLDLYQVELFSLCLYLFPTFHSSIILCSCVSPASVDFLSLGSEWTILSPNFSCHWLPQYPFLRLGNHILSCVWNINKIPFWGCVQRKMMQNQMAVRLMILLPFKTSAFSEKFGFRILHQNLQGE